MFPIACASVASTRSSRNPIHPLWYGRNWSSFSEMKRTSIEFRSRMNVALLVLALSTAAFGQSAPQNTKDVQAILDRLDQLEKDNQALLQEVRALRQEVSSLRAPEPGAAPSTTADHPQAVAENRIDELA